MIHKMQAILNLVPNADVSILDGEVTWNNPSIPPVTDEQIEQEMQRIQTDYVAKEYQRKRAKAYPSIADQLDILYHSGFDAWKLAIQAVKEEFPKP